MINTIVFDKNILWKNTELSTDRERRVMAPGQFLCFVGKKYGAWPPIFCKYVLITFTQVLDKWMEIDFKP